MKALVGVIENPSTLLALLFVAVGHSALAGGINYPDFASPTGLVFQGDAQLQESFVRLTRSRAGQVGWAGFTASTGDDSENHDILNWAFSKDQPHMRIPSSVNLRHTVYASTDMVNWTAVTNLTLYFSDPAAPDYDHRFYMFREK